MTRPVLLLIVVLALLAGGMVLLARSHGEKAQVRVEKVVPLASLQQ
ncbi:MAG: hypothetical protein ACKVOB_07970 [Sphingomonas sp.]